MLQYALTILAGIALGVAGMRVWMSSREGPAPVEPAADASPDIPEAPATTAAARAAALLTTRGLLIGAGALAVTAAGILVVRGPASDSGTATTAMPGAATGAGAPAKDLADVDSMIARLAERLNANPNDGEGFRMLGWSELMTGHPDRAMEPYRHALALLPGNASVQEGYGEALTAVATGTVTPEAKAAFEKAVAIDPAEPRARYFLAKWLAQHGQRQQALDAWIGIANSGPGDAPWQADLRRDISATAAALGTDVSARLKSPAPALAAVPGATGQMPALDPGVAQAAGQMPAPDRDRMIGGMVDGLAKRLQASPDDPDGWIRLLRSRMVLKQDATARDDLALARRAMAKDPQGLQRLNAAAREIGVPGAQ